MRTTSPAHLQFEEALDCQRFPRKWQMTQQQNRMLRGQCNFLHGMNHVFYDLILPRRNLTKLFRSIGKQRSKLFSTFLTWAEIHLTCCVWPSLVCGAGYDVFVCFDDDFVCGGHGMSWYVVFLCFDASTSSVFLVVSSTMVTYMQCHRAHRQVHHILGFSGCLHTRIGELACRCEQSTNALASFRRIDQRKGGPKGRSVS